MIISMKAMGSTVIAKNNNKRQYPIIKSRREGRGGAFDNNRFLASGRKNLIERKSTSGRGCDINKRNG